MLKKFYITLPALIALLSFPLVVLSQQRSAPFVSPEIHPDKSVTFRFRAPDAKDVKLNSQITSQPQQMIKDEKGIWSVTIGPVRPDIYPYCFVVR